MQLSPSLQVSDAIDYFLSHVGMTYADHTHAAYSQALNVFSRFLKDHKKVFAAQTTISAIRTEWATGFLAHLQETRSVETEHLYIRAILHFYSFVAERCGDSLGSSELAAHILQNRRPKTHQLPELPITAIAMVIAYAESIQPSAPTNDTEYRDFLRALRDKAFLLTLADTGLRVSEICGLRLGHVDGNANVLHLSDPFTLPLSKRALHHIQTYQSARAQLDRSQTILPYVQLPLFARHDKRASSRILPISRWTGGNIVEDWTRQALPADVYHALEQNGQQITPHSFRHYFVMMTLSQTSNLETARSLARHEDPSTTRRYLSQLTGASTADKSSS